MKAAKTGQKKAIASSSQTPPGTNQDRLGLILKPNPPPARIGLFMWRLCKERCQTEILLDKARSPRHPVSMTAIEHAHHILDTMLGYLGFSVQIEEQDSPEGPTLQILTKDSDSLTGRRGEILEDIQYLVNRILLRHIKDAPRIRVDVEYFRSMREDNLVEHAKQMAQRVRATGRATVLSPMNSYYRRLVHNVFADDPEVMSVSENGPARFKSITLKKRR